MSVVNIDISKICAEKMKKRGAEKKIHTECELIRDDL